MTTPRSKTQSASKPTANGATAERWNSWRKPEFKNVHVPLDYPEDRLADLKRVEDNLFKYPPLVFAGKTEALKAQVTQIKDEVERAKVRTNLEETLRLLREFETGLPAAAAEFKRGSTPVKVVLQEAVRLAERFGTERSARFVNGVLDQYARRLGRL